MNRYQITLHPSKEPYEPIMVSTAIPKKDVKCCICGKTTCDHISEISSRERIRHYLDLYPMRMDPVVANAIDTMASFDYSAVERRILNSLSQEIK